MTALYKKIFNFKLKNNLKISVQDNELYNQLLLYIYSLCPKNFLILTSNLNEASKIYNNLKNYEQNVFIFPDDDYLTKKAIASSPELTMMRLDLLNKINILDKKIVICHLNSFLKKIPSPEKYLSNRINLKKKFNINRAKFINKLLEMGYVKETIASSTGEFAIRGFIIDIFPFCEEHPIRIELFENEVENLKIFDENTQRTISDIESITILPVRDEYNDNDSNIINYLDNPYILVQDYNKIILTENNLKEQIKYYKEESFQDFSFQDFLNNNLIYVDLIDNKGKYDYEYHSKNQRNYNENIKGFIEDINDSAKAVLYSQNKNIIERINLKNVDLKKEYLNKGFVFDNISYFCDNDLKKEINNYSFKSLYRLGKKIDSVGNIKIKDFVVHKDHGIGIYNGIVTIEKNSIKRDYILINYKGSDKLYLPVENINKLYKYSGKEGARPKLQKLNSKEWNYTKEKIKNKIKDVTEELLNIYRVRNLAKIEPFLPDSSLQIEFEKKFEFDETLDQIKAINDIKSDFEGSIPMDRLLCGDVGYGKTEVIFRAMFKTVDNLKQVMYLCPTTVLSFQQYNNALNRFRSFGVNIALLNRYVSKKSAKKILEEFALGKIDIIIGTHRLLSEDIKPKDLGLLVIDEEHRFGVMHKEKIKKFKNNVHILSVSATPIPRSLQMSLVGIRDLSLIDTPPKNRLPVQTYVINYDEVLIREAILKEINRGGQVFVLYNNIENMNKVVEKYKFMLPELRISYAHGQMNKDTIQDIMYNFTNNEYDVLITTTIIENGIDIPNVNTIIIIDADKFGLSQLYQIRGRVGRSDRIAYAYLMYNKSKILNETAIKRLNAIKEFTELGSGYKIAMRDLSIRGFGDLLGKEQSGFIDAIGVDLYLELINEQLKGVKEEIDNTNQKIDDIETHIDELYSTDDEIIIDLHKKISAISNLNELFKVQSEIIDRFGKIDEKLYIYMYQKLLEKELEKEEIKILENKDSYITLKINEDVYKNINIEELFVKSITITSKFNFIYRNKSIIIKLNKLNLEENYILYLVKFVNLVQKIKKSD